ncbi:hypothetical protein V8D89_001768 [Ganoderma adspersum]
MDATCPTSAQPDSPTGRYVILYPSDDMTAVERRVADVIRYDLHLREDSPPDIYLLAEEGRELRIVVKRSRDPGARSTESESTTAVESFLSVASESTVGNPDLSDDPFQVSRAMKVSQPTFRTEDDPPQIRGSYTDMAYTDDAIEGMESYVKDKWALYYLQITIDFQGHKMSFNVQADTGADSAWLFHRNACRLQDIIDYWDAQARVACQVTLIAGTKRPDSRPALPPSYMPSYLEKQIGKETGLGAKVPIHAHYHYPRIAYGSGNTKLIVGPMRHPIEFEIENAQNWLTFGSDRKENLKARFAFAICDAATTSIIQDMRIDGLIGFGPELYASPLSEDTSLH